MRIILFILFIVYTILIGQTESQIKQAENFIKSNSISENEARKIAKSMGYSDTDINTVIEKEKNDDESINVNSIQLPELGASNKVIFEKTLKTSLVEELPELKDDVLIIKSDQAKSEKLVLPYFGYNIFKKDPALFQATSLGAVNPNYLIGPGDEIIIMLWGETQFRQLLNVDREGFVFIPEIGQVFVNGLNLNLLESKLFRVFSQSYASLNPPNDKPTTFLDLSLGNLRPLRIQVLGEVDQPGAYTINHSSTLFSALYYFNGPTKYGSLRDIRLIRNGEQIASIDFYEYLLKGKKPNDQKLQLDDVIFIPRRLKTVSIYGAINRSGIYELKENEGFTDLISIAGGLKITAYLDRAQIDRVVPFEKRSSLGIDRMYKDINISDGLASKNKISLQEGDKIQIFSVLETRMNTVTIEGSINRPGKYDLGDSLKLSELILKADGITSDAYLERLDVIRVKPDLQEELINLDLREVLKENNFHDIKLYHQDKIRVYGMSEMIDKKYVVLEGHVKNPGQRRLQQEMTAYDLLFKYGGFLDPKFKERTFLERADLIRFNNDQITKSIFNFNLKNLLESENSDENFLLVAGDIIRIYGNDILHNNYPIFINGDIKNEVSFKSYKTNMTIKDLILDAGGLSGNSDKYKVDIIRIDSSDKNLDSFASSITLFIDSNLEIVKENTLFAVESDSAKELSSFYLKPYDMISVRSNPKSKKHRKVFLSGEVLYPGKYVILNSDDKVSDIILRGGGLLKNAYPEAAIYRRKNIKINVSLGEIIKNPKSNLNFNVLDGDEITIPPQPNLINILGEVNSPGIHKFNRNKKINYYINLAGGLKPNADKNNIWIEYPNGDSKKYKKWEIWKSKIIDGSSIIISAKEDEEPIDKTELAKEISSIIANIAQSIAVLSIIRN